MARFTKRYQIVVILTIFLETVLEGVTESPDYVSKNEKTEDELYHQKIGTEKINTLKNELFEGNGDKKFTKIKRFSNKDGVLSRSKYSDSINSKLRLKKSEPFIRNANLINPINVSITQSEQLCVRAFENQQPCTCYHPDHSNVLQIELNTDETTKNASSLNGTGPASCEDIQSLGYKLPGFYLVHFKPKRVKAIYCGFNQIFQNLSNENAATKMIFKRYDSGSSKIQFCNYSESQLCTFLYSDYPDVPKFHLKKNNKTSNSIVLSEYNFEPTNCIDLKMVGHSLSGFYVVRFNAIKVQIFFCDFNPIIETVKGKRVKRFTLKKNGTEPQKNITRICQGIGSQPCSCFYSNSTEILQFELSDDDTTRIAINENGTGPSTCEELKQFGHSLNGFYFLRQNTTIIKTAYCTLNETDQQAKNPNQSNISTVNNIETGTETPTNKKKKQKQNCDNILKGKDITHDNIPVQKCVSRPEMCSGFGAQPCTCYYPDHPNVTVFGLDVDEITINATHVNGTGPESCEHLQSIGHYLAGFYLVRFNPKRVKAIYCGFNQTLVDFTSKLKVATKSSLKQIRDPGSSEIIRLCNGFGNQSCTFLYTDYPDTPLIQSMRNKKAADTNASCETCFLGPTSCDDLRLIGHKINGFYIIRQNALKVKIIYCNFNQIIDNVSELIRTKRSTLKKKSTTISSKTFTRACRDIGSQPCSCYYSNNRDILQFEMSNDEITMNAMDQNGTGPATCGELKELGYTLNGFFMLRFNTTTIKIAYCNLKESKIKIKKNKNGFSIKPSTTLLEIKTSTPTAVIKKEKKNKYEISTIYPTRTKNDFKMTSPSLSPATKNIRRKCKPDYRIYHVKSEAQQDFCVEMTTQKSLSLSECDNFPLEQQWTYLQSPTELVYLICIASGQNCVTVISPPWLSGRKPEVTVKNMDFPMNNRRQHWIFDDETSQLRNIATGLCLVVISSNVKNPVLSNEGKWKFEMNPCLPKPGKNQKWSLARVRDQNNVTLCGQNGLDP